MGALVDGRANQCAIRPEHSLRGGNLDCYPDRVWGMDVTLISKYSYE